MKKIIGNELTKIVVGLVFLALGILFKYFKYSTASLILLIAALLISGAGVFLDAVKRIIKKDFLDEKFLMSIASIGAFAIGESVEGVAVMLFFLVGEYFEHKAVRRSRGSIKALMDICPDTAVVIRDGAEYTEDSEDVEVGETIIIRSGERVPIDARVVSGSCELDTSMLTGESMPRSVTVGSVVESGTVVLGGVITAVTLRTAETSAASRVLELVECATERKSREENFITKFSRFYTPTVTVLAVLMAVIPPIFGWLSFEASLYRALSFLVVSCPCALVISVPMAFFGGIGGSASRGILYKGGNTFSAIAHPENIVFDKTGTLTLGELTIDEVSPVGISKDELLSLALSAEYASCHPIAAALKRSGAKLLSADDAREIAGYGVTAVIEGKRVAVGNAKLMKKEGAVLPSSVPDSGVLVSCNGEYVGSISFRDAVKNEAKRTIDELKRLGVKRTFILSGDNEKSVAAVAHELGIDEHHSSLLPENKFDILEKIINDSKGSTVYVGDGINDAPCLGRADVGIAMGGRGTDSAIEASDAVIMSDDLSRIPDTVRIARKTIAIAKENIIFAIGVKLLVILLVSVNLAGMWLAVFADVGVAVIAILNAMRTLVFSKRKNQ